MKTNKILLSTLAIFGLASCATPENFTIRTISPTGAPTIAFYDKWLDTTNFVTSTGPLVLAEFQKGDYEAIAYDSTTALSKLSTYSTDYKFVKLLTGGNLYLTSINKDANAMPTSDDIVVGFQKQGVPGKVFQKLMDDYWNLDATVEWAGDAATAKAVLETGKYNGIDVDYVFMAQPALQTVLANTSIEHDIKVIKNIKEEWKSFTGQDAIPQAGLFVKQSSYDAHKTEYNQYFDYIDANLELALTNPIAIKESIESQIPNAQQQGARYGYPAAVMAKVQQNGNNGFGVVDPDTTYGMNEINAFLTALGEETISEQYFLVK